MSLPAPPLTVEQLPAEVAYLLLGDLRLLLEEPAEVSTHRWLVSILDYLLACPVRLESVIPGHDSPGLPFDRDDALFYGKLQRLRDRIAHHKPYAILANEVRCDLRNMLAGELNPTLATLHDCA